MTMQCAKCGQSIEPEEASNPCPKCGSLDRDVFIKEEFKMLEILKIRAKSSDGFKLFERKHGEKLSKHGRVAREFLEFDHRDPTTTTKTHIVEERADDSSWKLEHDEHIIYPFKHRPK